MSNDVLTSLRRVGGINTNTKTPGKRKHMCVCMCTHTHILRWECPGRWGRGKLYRQVLSLQPWYQLPSLHNLTMMKWSNKISVMKAASPIMSLWWPITEPSQHPILKMRKVSLRAVKSLVQGPTAIDARGGIWTPTQTCSLHFAAFCSCL